MAIGLGGIKTAFRNIMVNNNTTTSEGLSENLSTKVAFIGKTNFEKVMFDAEKYPFVTCYYDNYEIESETMAKDQATGKRLATLEMKIAAGIWNPNFGAITADPADDELEILLENIETVMRNNTDMSATCDWQKPTGVEFNTFIATDEEDDAHIRVGIMTLEIIKRY